MRTEAARPPEEPPGRMTAAMRAAMLHPPVRPRAQLPPSVRSGALAVDWTFTAIAAFSFLVHFGFVGSMYSDWLDPVVDDGFTARLVQAPDPTPASTAPVVETAPQAPPTAAPNGAPSTQAPSSPAPAPRPTAHPALPSAGDVARLLAQLQGPEIGMLVTAGKGSNLARAMATPEGAPVDLDLLGRKGDSRSIGAIRFPGGVDAPLAANPDLRALRGDPTAPVASTAGTARPVLLPAVVTTAGPILAPQIANVEAVLRHDLFPRAHRCYQRALQDAAMAGRVMLVIRVAPSGEVASATVESHAGLSDDVARCVQAAAMGLRFSPPGPAGATLRVPLEFVAQHAR